MKIVLTQTELERALHEHYPVPPGYRIAEVSISKYSQDYCEIEMHELTYTAPALAGLANELPPLEAA